MSQLPQHIGLQSKEQSGTGEANSFHGEPEFEKTIERVQRRRFLIRGFFAVIFAAGLVWVGIRIFKHVTFVDDIVPDYSSLIIEAGGKIRPMTYEDDKYWEKRTLIDIATAQSAPNQKIRYQRFSRYLGRTFQLAQGLDSQYSRITAVSAIARTLAENDIGFTVDDQMKKLGSSGFAASMHCRVMVSQALMYLRQQKDPSAKVIIAECRRLSIDSDQRLNSAINEETFFGTVTVLAFFQNQELSAYFQQQLEFAQIISVDQQSRAFRLIASEQVRTGMYDAAVATLKKIKNPIELARAIELLFQYSARPLKIQLVEPAMLRLPAEPVTDALMYPERVKQIVKEVFAWMNKTFDAQENIDLLQRIAGSPLMYNDEMHKLFGNILQNSPEFADTVKAPVIEMLKNPQSTGIRQVPDSITRKPFSDPINNDWGTSEDTVFVEVIAIDNTPLVRRANEQEIQTSVLIAQSYLLVDRNTDAVKVIRKLLRQQGLKPLVKLSAAEILITAGNLSDVPKLLQDAAKFPDAAAEIRTEAARLQVIARLFGDAQKTLADIPAESAAKDHTARFLALEQIRVHQLDDAAKTIATIKTARQKSELQHYWNIAAGKAADEDYQAVNIPNPATQTDDALFIRICELLIQSGLLNTAEMVMEQVNKPAEKERCRERLIQEYVLAYNTYRGTDVLHKQTRQSIQDRIQNLLKPDTAAFSSYIAVLRNMPGNTEFHRQLWTKAFAAVNSVQDIEVRTGGYAQLLLSKIAMERPAGKHTYPLLTKTDNPLVYEELTNLIGTCQQSIELADSPAKQCLPCATLANAAAQVGRVKSAHMLLERAQEFLAKLHDPNMTVETVLLLVPVYKALNEQDTIPSVYQSALDSISRSFTEQTSNVNEYEWRVRDSSVERLLRNEIEYGFIDAAVQKMNRIQEPMLRDRLLRACAYIYLDQGNIPVAETLARRMTVKSLQKPALDNILLFKRRAEQREAVLQE